MTWATTYFLIFGQPWNCHGAGRRVAQFAGICVSERILRLKVQWKSPPPPPWTYLVLISLCHVLGLCLCTFMSLFYVCVLCAQSCLTLCNPMDYSLPSSSLHGIFQARYWSRLLFPSPGELPDPGIQTSSLVSLALAGGVFTTVPPGKPIFYVCVLLTFVPRTLPSSHVPHSEILLP